MKTTRTLPRQIRFLVFLAFAVGLIPLILHSRLTNSLKKSSIVIFGNDDDVPEQEIKERQQRDDTDARELTMKTTTTTTTTLPLLSRQSEGKLPNVVIVQETPHNVQQQRHSAAAATTATTATTFFKAPHVIDDMLENKQAEKQQQQLHKQQQQHNQHEDYVMFYNVYIPSDDSIHTQKQKNRDIHGRPATQTNALRILQEQLGQVRDSFAVTSRNVTFLYYNTIGQENVVSPSFVQEHFCSHNSNSSSAAQGGASGKLECVHLHHYDQGFEEVTLNDVYQWCSTIDDDDDQNNHHHHQHQRIAVTYLHNKGSHHNRAGGSNDYWRWHMTNAVTSADCITSTTATTANTAMSTKSLSCQACGLLWQTIPSLHFPGNFWTARCDYIQQLLPPTADDYGVRQTHMAQVLKNMTTTTTTTTLQQQSMLTSNLYSTGGTSAEWSTGTSRYMWEQWLGSHPDLQHICDVSTTLDLDVWKGPPKTLSKNFVLSQAPRRALLGDKHWQIKPRPNGSILTQPRLRQREMHLLPGLLWKWYLLYESLPTPFDNDDPYTSWSSSSSWVYTHFPEGQDWKRRVADILSLHDDNNNVSNSSSLMQDLFALAAKEDETGSILTTARKASTSDKNARATPKVVPIETVSHIGDNAATYNNNNNNNATTNWRALLGGYFQHSDETDSASAAPVVPWVVFYNIFIPHVNDTANDEDNNAVVQNVLRIVEEQLQQLRQSFAAVASRPLTVFYATIGRRNVLTGSVMTKLCGSRDDEDKNIDAATTTDSTRRVPVMPPVLDCRHLGHYDEGYEDVTLQRLYDFCQSIDDNKADNSVKKKSNNKVDNDNNMSVIYMHSKGTFHNWPDDSNERWRRHLTAAVTSRECLEPFQPEASSRSINATGTCNVCGLQFYPVWTPFFPGNFFAAQCSYIRELLPLNDFATKMTSILSEMAWRKNQGRFLTSLYNPKREGALGVARYAWEHWIASHPTVRPCDVSKTAHFRYWVAEDHYIEPDYVWSMAPRHDLATAPWYRIQTGKRVQVMANKSQRMREYYLLAGNLFKWQHLYNASPPADSWVWDFFPDGPEWHAAVAVHGLEQVVDKVTAEYAKK